VYLKNNFFNCHSDWNGGINNWCFTEISTEEEKSCYSKPIPSFRFLRSGRNCVPFN